MKLSLKMSTGTNEQLLQIASIEKRVNAIREIINSQDLLNNYAHIPNIVIQLVIELKNTWQDATLTNEVLREAKKTVISYHIDALNLLLRNV